MTAVELHVSAAALERATESAVMAWCAEGRRALTAASNLVDAKGILDVADTLAHATRLRDMNAEAVIAASKLKLQAERRMGELIAAEREAGSLAKATSGRPRLVAVPESLTGDEAYSETESLTGDEAYSSPPPATLADHGITWNEASAYSKLAAVDADTFEAVLDDVAVDATTQRVGVTRAAVLRKLNPTAEMRPDERFLAFGKVIDRARQLADAAEAVLPTVRFTPDALGDMCPDATRATALRHFDRVLTAITSLRKEITR